MPTESFADRYAPLLLVCFFSLIAVYGVLAIYHPAITFDAGTKGSGVPCDVPTGEKPRPQYNSEPTTNFLDVEGPHESEAHIDASKHDCSDKSHRLEVQELMAQCAVQRDEAMDSDVRSFLDCVLATLAWEEKMVNPRRRASEEGMSGRKVMLRDARRRLWD